jgi:transposase-like protein
MPRLHKPADLFRHFNSSPEVIRPVVMMYVRFPLSLRSVSDLPSPKIGRLNERPVSEARN